MKSLNKVLFATLLFFMAGTVEVQSMTFNEGKGPDEPVIFFDDAQKAEIEREFMAHLPARKLEIMKNLFDLGFGYWIEEDTADRSFIRKLFIELVTDKIMPGFFTDELCSALLEHMKNRHDQKKDRLE